METSHLYEREWQWPDIDRTEHAKRKASVEHLLNLYKTQVSTRSVWNTIAIFRHQELGAQVWVSKQVSDDLLASDMDTPDFEDIVWPAESLEFYFEDRDLATVLLVNDAENLLFKWIEKTVGDVVMINEFKPLVSILLQQKLPEGIAMTSSAVTPQDIRLFCDQDLPMPVADMELDDQEDAAVRFMASLACKVLMLASIPKFRPQPTWDQPTKKEGGKAGHLNRPKLPRYVVKYLPEHLQERAAHARKVRQEAEAAGKVFRGRNGHMRKYRDDRYVNMKGKQQFIFPVPGPDGTLPKRKFKVK